MCNELGVCQGPISHNNEQTQSVEDLISSCRDDVRNYILPINTGDFTHTLHNMTFFQNTLRIHGRILWHIPITTDGFISITGHCRRRYTRFTQLCVCPRNTLKIHGRVL